MMGRKTDKGVDVGVGIVYTVSNILWAVIFGFGGILMIATGSAGTKFLGMLSVLFGAYGAYRTVRMWTPRR